MSFRTVERLDRRQVEDLCRLFQAAWWTRGRRPEDVRGMLAHSDLVFGLVEEPEGGLVAFARVLTDGVYKALILDVMVAEPWLGQGLGRRLLDLVLTHPDVAAVRHFELYCTGDMVPFYESWGFTTDLGDLHLMRRVTRRPPEPESSGPGGGTRLPG